LCPRTPQIWHRQSATQENDNKDENHVDDQENDMTNNSKEEEEKTVQNAPIENHDNSRGLHIIIRFPV
jgi:hypothetical protein